MILLLDLETGGLDSAKSPILEIGAVWLHDDAEFFRCTRSTRRTTIGPDALRVNGLTPETNADTSRILDTSAACELVGWVKSRTIEPRSVKLCGWNVHFDLRFLTDALTRAGIPIGTTPFSHQVFDLHSALLLDRLRENSACDPALYGSRTILSGGDHGSKLIGIPEEAKPHNALAGALWAKSIAQKLISRVESLNPQPSTLNEQ